MGTLAGIELVKLLVERGDFGFDVFADAGGIVIHFDGHLLEARGDARNRAAGGDGVLAAQAAEKVQRPASVLGQIADILAVALVDDAVQPALRSPGLDQGEPGLRIVDVFEVALELYDELSLRQRPSLRWRSMSIA